LGDFLKIAPNLVTMITNRAGSVVRGPLALVSLQPVEDDAEPSLLLPPERGGVGSAARRRGRALLRLLALRNCPEVAGLGPML
jgi:hypothetical protein